MAHSVLLLAGFNWGGGIISWVIIGAIAGALAGMVMRGGGYGLLGDIIVGIVGAFIGGIILAFIGGSANNWWETLITAFIGACILIAILRAVAPGSRASV